MRDHKIVNIGKYIFGLGFLLGNIFFSGYFITEKSWFFEWGIVFLFYGIIANLLAVIGLILYGFAEKLKMNACLKVIGLIMFNIPLGFLYVMLGINLISK
ncbi:hypothetical protein CLU96_0055 [Chryseobacterium sp. 52]|uniref:hypothetical protein n=1 Tax=Chryseobacterium sp. 52 TaxID=2035213 RepID=UPI000C17DF03|nr:hypothetical protein [Chryseobacterium sp. 52]PIF43151.1 hypothetical protein CLU96_0055 [Chryseobacterium sp. 52]